MTMGHQSHPMRSAHRNAGVGFVALTSAAANPLTVTLDEGGLITGTTVRDAQGLYTVTLTSQWKHVRAVANIKDSTNTVFAKVVAIVEGSGATNTVQVQTEAAGIADDTNAKVVDLLLFLTR